MLSKLPSSLTVILIFTIGLICVAPPAVAQTTMSVPIPTKALPFTIVSRSAGATVGITPDTENGGYDLPGANSDLPDLEELLHFGGTIELQMKPTNRNFTAGDTPSADEATALAAAWTKAVENSASDDDRKATAWHDFVITEIMWALDGDSADKQWIEIFNNAGVNVPSRTLLRLALYPNERKTDAPDVVRDSEWVLVDRVRLSDHFGNRWALKGQSGNTAVAANENAPLASLISMYRKNDLDANGTAYKSDKIVDGEFWSDGTEGTSWEASEARTNMTGRYYIGTPFASHRLNPGGGKIYEKANVAAVSSGGTGIIINEIRDDPSNRNIDWIELHNNNTDPISVKDWRIRLITATQNDDSTYKDYKTAVLAILPDYRIPAGEYLLVVNRDPEETVLAGGVNLNEVANGTDVSRGAAHVYYVSDDLNLPGSGKYLLVVRSGAKNASGVDDEPDNNNYHEQFVDFAGNGFFTEDVQAGTNLWPLRGWTIPDDRESEDFGTLGTYVAPGVSFGRTGSRAKRLHHEDWQAFGPQGGLGYDRDVNLTTAPGTPGYANDALSNFVLDDKDNFSARDDVVFDGRISISEVMYDAGPRWKLGQWIELYNSSMTTAVNLKGWTLEIRNKNNTQSYSDASFEFEDATILPNQTLLLVSGSAPNDVASNRVYNLYQRHRRELGLLARDSVLLSRTGFCLKLIGKNRQDGRELDVVMDEAGNIRVNGAKRAVMWELPARDPAVRQSLVRQYGTRVIDGDGPDGASNGTKQSAWRQSDLTSASLSYYGNRNDIGTPGYRQGGPLPVSLSGFRPVRNKGTGYVDIMWITESELNNAGFNILRSESKTGAFKVINVKGIISGRGTTGEKHVYTFTDTTAKPNVAYYYRIEDVSLSGQRTTLTTTHLRGNVSVAGKLTTMWSDLKEQR